MTRGLFEEMSGLDRLVHEPSRLAILTALAECKSADYVFLNSLVGLTKGNMSAHLRKLEAAGFVAITKSFKGKVPNTNIAITATGRDAVRKHWKQLRELRRAADRWSPAKALKERSA